MTPTRAATPTQTWLTAANFLPPVTGAAATAERLLLLLHYGINIFKLLLRRWQLAGPSP